MDSSIMHPTDARFAPSETRLLRSISDLGIRGVSALGAAAYRLIGPRIDGQFGILLYHRIADRIEGIEQPSINVTPRQFERQILGLIQAGFVFWPLRRVQDHLARGESIPPYVAVLTFDDGFECIYHNAWPLLRRFNLPATVFLATAYLGSQQPLPFDHWGKRYSGCVPPSAYRSMTVEQCRELAASGLIEFGAHTHTHEDFRGRPGDFREDLQKNILALDELCGISNVSFAFPYGTPRLGFTDDSLTAAAREVGVRCALTTRGALVKPGDSPFAWGRFTVFPWDNGTTLAAKLGGWYSWAPELKNRLLPTRRDKALFCPAESRHAKRHPTEIAPILDEATLQPTKLQRSQTISVIVPTFNRANWLAAALRSLIQQQTNDRFQFEIVVCDNASTDDTAKVIAAIAESSSIPIKYCYQATPGDAPARNLALQQATGQWLAFFDDDQLAAENWLAELVTAAEKTEGTIIGGAVQLDLSARQRRALGPLIREALRETELYSQLQPYLRHALPGTGNALIARVVFETIGGFDESFVNGGSDYDFFSRARAAGFALWYTPDAVIRHRLEPRRLSAEYLRRDALSGGAAHAEYLDFSQFGLIAITGRGLARIVQALVIHGPLLLAAWLQRDRTQVLGRRIRLWRTEGYLRKGIALVAPRLFPQRHFFDEFSCRHGRTNAAVQQPKAST